MPPATRDKLAKSRASTAREKTPPSPVNSDDGIFAAAMQQLLIKHEQKKKDKSTRLLKELESETRDATQEKVLEVQGLWDEVDDLFQRFALDYAANEDKIRKLYEELEQETRRLHTHMEEKLAMTIKRDKWREKNHIKGLTLTRKSCEDFRLLVQEYEDLAD
ncbi:hypothetical protein BJ322DRAFT_722663 [Thelephora terrestris]|uniref:Uncharacterized protein n=1 Tax=Thelephora terrestris TaxID=56493 RepID=A0A9P6HI75_9AGAM|nr:hypothetical protein BJ322DRAFT_722663 [Thelephora terrestris]